MINIILGILGFVSCVAILYLIALVDMRGDWRRCGYLRLADTGNVQD